MKKRMMYLLTVVIALTVVVLTPAPTYAAYPGCHTDAGTVAEQSVLREAFPEDSASYYDSGVHIRTVKVSRCPGLDGGPERTVIFYEATVYNAKYLGDYQYLNQRRREMREALQYLQDSELDYDNVHFTFTARVEDKWGTPAQTHAPYEWIKALEAVFDRAFIINMTTSDVSPSASALLKFAKYSEIHPALLDNVGGTEQ